MGSLLPPVAGVDEAAADAACSHGDCNTCTSRGRRYIRFAGPAGAMLFHGEHDIKDQVMKKLKGYADTTCIQDVKPELVLVTPQHVRGQPVHRSSWE